MRLLIGLSTLLVAFASAQNPAVEVDSRYPPKGLEFDVTGAEPAFNPKQKATHNCYTYAIQNSETYYLHRTPGGYEASDGCAALAKGVVGDSKGKAKMIACPSEAESSKAVCEKDSSLIMLFRGVVDFDNMILDFHFYRQDSNGFFSHQLGSTISNLDADGKLINDPRRANRKHPDMNGSYKELCACFCVTKGGFKL